MVLKASRVKRFIEKYLWVTKDYEILFIPLMKTDHLRNTVKMILRRACREGYEMRSVVEHPHDISEVDTTAYAMFPSYKKMLLMLKVLEKRGNNNTEFQGYLDGYRELVRGERW